MSGGEGCCILQIRVCQGPIPLITTAVSLIRRALEQQLRPVRAYQGTMPLFERSSQGIRNCNRGSHAEDRSTRNTKWIQSRMTKVESAEQRKGVVAKAVGTGGF